MNSILAISVAVFCVVSLFYLSHSNMVATKGYAMKTLQEDRAYLQSELDTWNLKLTRLQALSVLAQADHVQQMENFTEAPIFVQSNTEVAFTGGVN